MEDQNRLQADQQMEAFLHKLRKQDPTIKCPSNKVITKLCINPKCKISFRCNDIKCLSCGKKVHFGCGCVSMEQFVEMINEQTEGCRQFIAKLHEIQRKFIDELRKKQKQFIQKYIYGTFQAKYGKTIEEIFQVKNYNALDGLEAMRLCEQMIQSEKQCISTEDKEKLKQYEEKLSHTIKQFQLKKYKWFLNPSKKHVSKLIVNDFCLPKKAMVPIDIDSLVLKAKYTVSEDLNYLYEILNKPKEVKLLYRGSLQNFSAFSFHNKCDKIKDTLVLVRTQFGKTIGGFSHYRWKKKVKQVDGELLACYVNDSERKSFLFQLDLHEKYTPDSRRGLIIGKNRWGPQFGKGLDLSIANECDKNDNSMSRFPGTYNLQDRPYPSGQESIASFCGATNSYKFKVVQYEVFQVLYD